MYERARVSIRVEDIDRSINYYTKKLGFRYVTKYGARFAELDAPGLTLLVHQRFEEQPEVAPSGVITISLEVADIDKARAELESRGVIFEGETVEIGRLKIAFTTDPDGVPVNLIASGFGG